MRQASFLTAISVFVLAAPVAIAQHDHVSAEEDKPWSQADAIWGEAAMDPSRHHVQKHHGHGRTFYVSADRLELQTGDDETLMLWDGDAWYGGDINKLWIKSEGEYDLDHGSVETAEVQLLWSRAVSSYFDVQAGLRQDIEPAGRSHAVVGLQGLAPYRFEIDTAAFLSEDGDLTASFEAEYELVLTQRLHLVPRAEIGWSAQDTSDLGIGEGVTGAEVGLRLSYDIIREVSPYIGIEWEGAFGETEDILSRSGEETSSFRAVIGLRFWY